MEATKHLDTEWEQSLAEVLKGNKEFQKQYITIVNHSERITKATLQVLSSLDTHYAMSPLVNEKFYENQMFVRYVVSKALKESSFTIETGERGNVLWPIYLEIFSKNGYTSTRAYMAENHDFLRKVMNQKAYRGFPEENRMQLCGIFQDADCLRDVVTYGPTFALRYYLRIAGFKDEEAATTFVEIVREVPVLIQSKELYNYTHEKLISGTLKAKYTNLRKKHGYGN